MALGGVVTALLGQTAGAWQKAWHAGRSWECTAPSAAASLGGPAPVGSARAMQVSESGTETLSGCDTSTSRSRAARGISKSSTAWPPLWPIRHATGKALGCWSLDTRLPAGLWTIFSRVWPWSFSSTPHLTGTLAGRMHCSMAGHETLRHPSTIPSDTHDAAIGRYEGTKELQSRTIFAAGTRGFKGAVIAVFGTGAIAQRALSRVRPIKPQFFACGTDIVARTRVKRCAPVAFSCSCSS